MDARSYDTVREIATALSNFLAQSARQTEEIKKLRARALLAERHIRDDAPQTAIGALHGAYDDEL